MSGRPCDRDGNFLHPDAAPLPKEVPPPDDFGPYCSLNQFRMADFLYRKVQMSAGEIDELMEILDGDGNTPPFTDHKDLYATIDATERGHVAWQAFEVAYDGSDLDAPNAPSWKRKNYTVYFRDPRAVLQQQLGNPDYKSEIDLSPRRVYDEKDEHVYENFMSGDWAWRQAVCHGLNLISTRSLSLPGRHCEGSGHSRLCIRPCHQRERQNHHFGCDGPK